jgi:oligopeptide transport system substrate-binding protein
MTGRFRIISLVLAIAGLMWFHHERQQRPARVDLARQNKTLILGNGSEPETLDLHLATGQPEHHIFSALFEGLVAPLPDNPDANGPGAAASWEHSADFVTWTFHLQPDGKWSDGTRVTAADFAYSYERALTPALASDYASMLYPLMNAEAFNKGEITDFSKVGVRAIDGLTLQFTLKGPTPYLPSMLKHYSWFPVQRRAIERFGKMTDRDTKWCRPGNMVSNGPFQLKDWRFTHSITVERNPYYWDAANVKLNQIVFLPIVNSGTEDRAFNDGQIHVTMPGSVPLDKIPIYRAERPDIYQQEPMLSTYFYRINTTKKPFDDKRVRKALALAIDRESLIRNVLRAGQKPALGLTPPGCGEGYETPMPLRFDPAEAKRLLAEAGFPDGKGFPKFDILINTLESHRTIAEAIMAMWKEHLNLPVTVLNQDWSVYLKSTRDLEYTVGRAGWVGDFLDPFTFLSIWQKGDGNNNTGWSSEKYDSLMAASCQEPDAQKRMAIMHEAEELLLDEQPIVPVYWYVVSYMKRPEVKGWLHSLLEHRCYKALELTPAS